MMIEHCNLEVQSCISKIFPHVQNILLIEIISQTSVMILSNLAGQHLAMITCKPVKIILNLGINMSSSMRLCGCFYGAKKSIRGTVLNWSNAHVLNIGIYVNTL